MIYAEYLSTAESNRWILDLDIPWDQADPQLAATQPDLLGRVRDSALIESFFPLFTPKALELLWDDVAATSVFSIQLYESYKHFHVFNQYLHRVNHRPIQDEEIIELRRKNRELRYDDGTRLLTWYMMSEHFAAHSFMKDSRQCAEPVLALILKLVGRDEVRHAQFAYDLLDLRIRRDPNEIHKVLDAAMHFRHIGLDAVDEIPVAEKNDFAAIVTANQKIERLTGRGLGLMSKEPAHA
jgi:hypothetical protein